MRPVSTHALTCAASGRCAPDAVISVITPLMVRPPRGGVGSLLGGVAAGLTGFNVSDDPPPLQEAAARSTVATMRA